MLNNMEEILEFQICGFHQYVLTEPIHLEYVSENLCKMLGLKKDELLNCGKDLYLMLVHPADREKYLEFIQVLKEKEQTLTSEYRMMKKDGSVIYVRDMFTTKKNEQGVLIGTSVLTDITDIKNENKNLQFLNETIPFGFLRYTCEKQPKITYINQKMIEMLRVPEVDAAEMDYFEMYMSNIFLIIPMEERRRFSKYLNRVFSEETPIAGEMSVLRFDGTRATIFGWVTKCINEEGKAEFQSVCMDITEQHQARKSAETKKYLKALTDVYDKIFEFNINSNTVKCIYCEDSSSFKKFEDIAVQMDDALEKWIIDAVVAEDRDNVRCFFKDFGNKKLYTKAAKPPQVTYKAKSSTGELKQYNGLFIKVDESLSLYCCRCVLETGDSEMLKTENSILKESMLNITKHFDGLAAFEISPEGLVKPLYVSENVYSFFGYTEDEWFEIMAKPVPVDNFVAYSEAAYDDFMGLLRTGEAEFTYFDYQLETERRMKAICSQREHNQNSPRYIMLYSVENTDTDEKKSLPENRTVTIRTFGYFDVFVGDKPIAFRNKKSKELFALLVDRKGGYVSSEEVISFLWEDEPINTVTLSRYRKVALRLKNTLEEYGISDVIESVNGKRRIVMEKVHCDLYDYLSGKEEYSQLFKGSYLTNYSWGETTLGELSNNWE